MYGVVPMTDAQLNTQGSERWVCGAKYVEKIDRLSKSGMYEVEITEP